MFPGKAGGRARGGGGGAAASLERGRHAARLVRGRATPQVARLSARARGDLVPSYILYVLLRIRGRLFAVFLYSFSLADGSLCKLTFCKF